MEFNHIDTVITSDELEKPLKLTKNGKVQEKIIVIQSYASTTRLLQFLNNIYTKIVCQMKGKMLL